MDPVVHLGLLAGTGMKGYMNDSIYSLPFYGTNQVTCQKYSYFVHLFFLFGSHLLASKKSTGVRVDSVFEKSDLLFRDLNMNLRVCL